MLLFNLDLLRNDPLAFLRLMSLMALALLVAITVHEFSHALSASRLGDPTARDRGRITLNPLAHLEPLGALMLLVVGFGWGKPVPVNRANLRHGRSGMAIVAASGAAANVVTAGVAALPVNLGWLPWHSPLGFLFFSGGTEGFLADLLGLIIFYNLILAIFNLIPVPPLDGFNVALGLLPRGAARSFAGMAQYGPVILIAIIAVGYVTQFNPLWAVMRPIVDGLAWLLVGRRF